MTLINQSQSDAKFVMEEEKKKEWLQYIYGYTDVLKCLENNTYNSIFKIPLQIIYTLVF